MDLSTRSKTDTIRLNITASQGTTNHGDEQLLCTPASWTDVLSFFLSNYFTHVATVVTYPGEPTDSIAFALVAALLLPTAGIGRGMSAIVRRAKLAKSPLEAAARAGALCMVVRSKGWTFEKGDKIRGATLRAPLVDLERKPTWLQALLNKALLGLLPISLGVIVRGVNEYLQSITLDLGHEWTSYDRVTLRLFRAPWENTNLPFWHFYDTEEDLVTKRTIHGSYHLADGYSLAYVPPSALVLPNVDQDESKTADAVSANYSLPKVPMAIIQLLFALITLYNAGTGPQIDHYGFAAYALTVIPYAFMSLVNLLGAAFTPSYPALYMIHSDVMEEAERRGSRFDGVVGRLVYEEPHVHNNIPECCFVTASFEENRTAVKKGRHTAQQSASSSEELGSFFGQSMDGRKYIRTSCRRVAMDLPSEANTSITLRYKQRDEKTGVDTLLTANPNGVNGPWCENGLPLQLCKGESRDSTILVPRCSNFRRRSKYFWDLYSVTLRYNNSANSFLDQIAVCFEVFGLQLVTNAYYVYISCLYIPIYGGLSQFRKQQSTRTQQIVTMIWLAFGILLGPWVLSVDSFKTYIIQPDIYSILIMPLSIPSSRLLITTLMGMLLLIYGAASIAGFVIVGKMIKDWGTCIQLY